MAGERALEKGLAGGEFNLISSLNSSRIQKSGPVSIPLLRIPIAFSTNIAMSEPNEAPANRRPVRPEGEREIASIDLLQGDRSVIIRHDGEAYRLILTRNNRLILQK